MKYIFKLFFATVVLVLGLILFTYKTIWDLDAKGIKEIWSSYKNFISRVFLKAFRYDIYSSPKKI